jgi:hypothetical protein
MPNPSSSLAIAGKPVPATVDDLRFEALQRLYLRREAVDALIHSLEMYEHAGILRRAPCVPISAGRTWSS